MTVLVSLAPLAVAVPFAFALDSVKGGLEWIVLVVSAMAAIYAVIRLMRRGAVALEELVKLVKGDADQPGLSARLEGIEHEIGAFRRIVDLARDEAVADVRTLLRRGEVPHPLLDEKDRPEPEGGA